MTGLAASPGTAVEPTWSSCSTRQPSARRIRPARRSYCRGQAGSGSVTLTPVPGPAPATHGLAPGGGGESSNDTISARLGIAQFMARSRRIQALNRTGHRLLLRSRVWSAGGAILVGCVSAQ